MFFIATTYCWGGLTFWWNITTHSLWTADSRGETIFISPTSFSVHHLTQERKRQKGKTERLREREGWWVGEVPFYSRCKTAQGCPCHPELADERKQAIKNQLKGFFLSLQLLSLLFSDMQFFSHLDCEPSHTRQGLFTFVSKPFLVYLTLEQIIKRWLSSPTFGTGTLKRRL